MTELELIVNNLYLLNTDDKNKALLEISKQYGNDYCYKVINKLANKVREQNNEFKYRSS